MAEKCAKCGKDMKEGEPFIMVGKTPSLGSRILKPMALRHVSLSWYGKIYHKKCYKK